MSAVSITLMPMSAAACTRRIAVRREMLEEYDVSLPVPRPTIEQFRSVSPMRRNFNATPLGAPADMHVQAPVWSSFAPCYASRTESTRLRDRSPQRRFDCLGRLDCLE